MPTKQQVQLVLDTAFEFLESKETGVALLLTKVIQSALDANLDLILGLIAAKIQKQQF